MVLLVTLFAFVFFPYEVLASHCYCTHIIPLICPALCLVFFVYVFVPSPSIGINRFKDESKLILIDLRGREK